MKKTIVFYDTEFTTWEGALENDWRGPGQYREIVQIGALRFDLGALAELDEFMVLSKPQKNPVLSDFFIQLTGITNEDVARDGLGFPDAYDKFRQFAGSDLCVSYGGDSDVVRENLAWHGLSATSTAFDCFNIRPWFRKYAAPFGVTEKTNSGKLASVLGVAINSIQEHNALHDVRSIAAGYRFMMGKGISSPLA